MRHIRQIMFIPVFLLALPALAQSLQVHPDLFDVTGVAGNDVLNIRQSPSGSSSKIGTLGPYQTGIEVIGSTTNGKWGLVNVGERSGWVSMRFLHPSARWSHTPPTDLSCTGTEPFWSVVFEPNGRASADWSPMGLTSSETQYVSGWSGTPINNNSKVFGFDLGNDISGNGISVSGVIRMTQCFDGMSNRTNGFAADIILGGAVHKVVSGCCSIVAR